MLRQQPQVFGPVASTPTAWRVLAGIGADDLAGLAAARAQARAWASETGRGVPAAQAGGRTIPGLVIDVDASVVICHLREGTRGPDVQAHLRLPPAVRLLRQHR